MSSVGQRQSDQTDDSSFNNIYDMAALKPANSRAYYSSGNVAPSDFKLKSGEARQPAQSGDTMTNTTTEEIKDKVAAAEARTDTKIAHIEGKIDNLSTMIAARFDASAVRSDTLQKDVDRARDEVRESRLVLVTTMIGSALALSGLLVAIVLYSDAMFGRGMNVRDVVQAVIKETATPPSTK